MDLKRTYPITLTSSAPIESSPLRLMLPFATHHEEARTLVPDRRTAGVTLLHWWQEINKSDTTTMSEAFVTVAPHNDEYWVRLVETLLGLFEADERFDVVCHRALPILIYGTEHPLYKAEFVTAIRNYEASPENDIKLWLQSRFAMTEQSVDEFWAAYDRKWRVLCATRNLSRPQDDSDLEMAFS